MKEFSVQFCCKNCNANNTFWFPVGTRIYRAPCMMWRFPRNRAVIINPDKFAEHVTLKCKVCEIGDVA